ncbi:MAG: hypothetical protein ABI718_10395 [Acidobacteriota bacterium]
MDELTRRIADTILYEGYVLYPYRPSSIKNKQRWTFGVLYPRAYSEVQRGSDRWNLHSECLIEAAAGEAIDVTLRFVQIATRDNWQVGIEREVALRHSLGQGQNEQSFAFDADARVQGRLTVRTVEVSTKVSRVVVEAENLTSFAAIDDRDACLPLSLASAHVVLTTTGGQFVSLLDPPPSLAEETKRCRNEGVFPVLVGETGSRTAVLASPIILYDHPEIAPESPGDLFDACEIDEILSLRIMTLTDEEKREACASDERARRIIERTDALTAEQLRDLHGTMRSLRK